MVVTCPNCQKQHKVNESRIPAGGVMAKCNGCSHRFKIEPPSEEQIKCPSCGHTQPKGVECTNCGVIFAKYKGRLKLRTTPIQRQAKPKGIASGTKENKELLNCTACGKKVSKQAKTCPHCGHPVPNLANIGGMMIRAGFSLLALGILLLVFFLL